MHSLVGSMKNKQDHNNYTWVPDWHSGTHDQAIHEHAGCPNKSGTMFWSSELFANESWKVYEKMYFAPKNCFLSIFCELQNWKSVIDPIFSWSDLFSKLEKIRTFILQLSKKCSKSNFLEQNTNFFVNVACLARKHF